MDNIFKDDTKEPDKAVTRWLNEIDSAKKREKQWRKDGQRIIDIYNCDEPEKVPYNILFSNTETLLPALYSAIPRPIVQRRFKDDDPVGRSAATAGQRGLEFLVDTNVEGYETFDEGVQAATLDALLPGRAVTCVKYDVDLGEMADEGGLSIDEDDPSPQADDETESEQTEPQTTPYKKSELVCLDTRSWNRVFFGYAKKWSKVPWIAYEEYVDKQEAERLFGEEMAAKLTYTTNENDYSTDGNEGKNGDPDEDNEGDRKTACVFQIWDKNGDGTEGSEKKIRYVSTQYKDGYLTVTDDPLQLTGFFNCPRPLQFMAKSNDLMPVAMYMAYENQARELNKITLRINGIVGAIKARGIYDSELGLDIANIMKEDDNALVPSDKTSSLAAEKGLQNAIWFLPIEQLINVLAQLTQARERCKQVIYEITGISDIIRGSSVASETATAQNLKSQWGTLRLKRLQKEVQRYARDLLRMMLEIAATKFSEDTWARMTGLPFLTTQQTQQLQQQAMAMQQQAQTMQQQAATTGQQIDPARQQQMQQAMQQMQQQMQAPTWTQILGVLRDDMQRAYRVDIETNSTIEPEAAEDQKNITDMMTAMGQFLNGVGPLVEQGIMPFQAAQAMLLAISRRFRFGTEIEDSLKAMQAPQPKGDDGKAAAAAADLKAQQTQLENDTKISKLEMALKTAEDEKKILQKELALEIRELQLANAQARLDVSEALAGERINLRDKVGAMHLLTTQKINEVNADQAAQQKEQEMNTTMQEGLQSAQDNSNKMVSGQLEQLANYAEQLAGVVTELSEQAKMASAPKNIIRDETGKISRIEPDMQTLNLGE